MSRPRVFQIGFNKCGTRSLAAFFRGNGWTVADWEKGALARDLRQAVDAGRRPFAERPAGTAFFDIECVTDDTLIEGCKCFAALEAAWPDAVFLLNTRSAEAWIRSRLGHLDGRYAARHRRHLGLSDDRALADHWRQDWHRHHLAVLEHFGGEKRGKLLIWDIDEPDFDGLDRLVGERLDRRHWRHLNRSRTLLSRLGL